MSGCGEPIAEQRAERAEGIVVTVGFTEKGKAVQSFQRILVAVELGASGRELRIGSRRALDRAVWLARRTSGSLTIVHSDRIDEYWNEALGRYVASDFVPASSRREALERALDACPLDGLEVEIIIRPETPTLAIIYEVLRSRIDVVVAGKRATRELDGRRLGSVARHLLRKCPCPVWLEDPRESRDPSVLLAATDLSTVGDRVVELAASVGAELGAELHVVHAYSLSMEAQLTGDKERDRYEREQRKAARKHLDEVLGRTPLAGKAEVHIGLTSATHAVLECVERLRPGLVVMGTLSRGGVSGLLMGNTAERLVDRIDCALLTIKPNDFVCPVPPAEA